MNQEFIWSPLESPSRTYFQKSRMKSTRSKQTKDSSQRRIKCYPNWVPSASTSWLTRNKTSRNWKKSWLSLNKRTTTDIQSPMIIFSWDPKSIAGTSTKTETLSCFKSRPGHVRLSATTFKTISSTWTTLSTRNKAAFKASNVNTTISSEEDSSNTHFNSRSEEWTARLLPTTTPRKYMDSNT